MSEEPLSVTLSVAHGKQQTGVPVKVSIEVRNNSARPVWIIGALDGSDTGMRYPHYLPRINGERPPLSADDEYLDVASPLRPEDFQQLQPGESFDPIKGLRLAVNPLLAHFVEFVPPAPGTYELRLTLSTESENDADWLGSGGHPRKDEVLRRLREVPRVSIASNKLAIEAE